MNNLIPTRSSRGVESAREEISLAHFSDGGTLEWFESTWMSEPQPLAADVWVFSPNFARILVVEHRWRGLVPPGGRVEPDETPREGARRELVEETGQDIALAERPAFAAVRSYRDDWPATLNISYWAIADPDATLTPESGQLARWIEFDTSWRSYHPQDAATMNSFVMAMRGQSR